jgi:hypothetical protein
MEREIGKVKIRELRSLTYTVPPASKVTRFENFFAYREPIKVIKVHVFFPPGCEDLVEVTMGSGFSIFAPLIKSGDGKTVEFEVNKELPPFTPVWAEITNYDTTYSHTVTIEVEIER